MFRSLNELMLVHIVVKRFVRTEYQSLFIKVDHNLQE